MTDSIYKTRRIPIHTYYLLLTCMFVLFTLISPWWFFKIAFAWAALSVGCVTAAYWFELPQLFRKRHDGSIPTIIRWIFIPFLGGAQLYNSWERRRDTVPSIQQIKPDLYLGTRLFPSDISTLKQFQIGAVLDVTAEFDALDWSLIDEPVDYLNIPVLDHQPVPIQRLIKGINWIHQQRQSGKGVLIHCALGRGRSVMMMAAYLLATSSENTVADVLKHLNTHRHTAKLNRKQFKMLEKAYQSGELTVRQNAYLIANPVSGGGKYEKYKEGIVEYLSPYYQLNWLLTDEDTDGTELTKQALEQGAELVVACGGDGTVTQVAEALVGTAIPLGIIPLGTTNALSHVLLGWHSKILPVDVACEHLIEGSMTQIDVAYSNDELTLLLAGVGFEQRMIELADRETKNRLGQFAYLHGLWQAIEQNNQLCLKVTLDDQPSETIQTASLTVANSAPFSTVLAQGKGAPNYQDGQLDITWLSADNQDTSPYLSLAELALAATSDIQLQQATQHAHAKRVQIEADDTLNYVVDGETRQAEKLIIEVKPKALNVIVANTP